MVFSRDKSWGSYGLDTVIGKSVVMLQSQEETTVCLGLGATFLDSALEAKKLSSVPGNSSQSGLSLSHCSLVSGGFSCNPSSPRSLCSHATAWHDILPTSARG